ncbi:putative serine/threonine-protein kinase PBL28 [Bidens hawaiensis]|uniref:putative serine/threonine-protein kinase PBL28 n=1 Tax=Bidens hawaiensis TaxID=980011 RepID=UPI0040493267
MSSDTLKIPLQEIYSATNQFSEENKIGEGGFGLVYIGQSKHHGKLAIKRLNRVHGQGDHEYGMEVTLLSKYKHKNLVSLIGFCGEDGEKILVYKYEAHQSLDKILHRKDLSWMRRLQICLGAARGLRYLHTDSGLGHGVIHRDIKSSNILLDENWNAKISDFGLSKIALTNSADSVVFTTPCGTRGYVDPQIIYGGITQKSDVYSFGVVLYEVLFGKLVAIPGYLGDRRFTIKMAKKHFEEKTLHMMIDSDLGAEMNSDSLSTFSSIAYQCLKKRTEDRPTMSLVVEALEKALGYQQASFVFLYDVYISTVGVETAHIVDCLYDDLKKEGFSTYKDDIKSPHNNSELISVIKQSRYIIIIFSKNFGADYWNLDEVAEIIECAKEKRNFVTSVFWDVSPSDVREQEAHFGKAISKYDTHPRVGVWRNALVEATNVPNIIYSDDRPCEALAKKVVERISSQRSQVTREKVNLENV